MLFIQSELISRMKKNSNNDIVLDINYFVVDFILYENIAYMLMKIIYTKYFSVRVDSYISALAMPDAKAPDCDRNANYAHPLIWSINTPRSIQDGRHFQSNFCERKFDCFNSDFIEVYSARSN